MSWLSETVIHHHPSPFPIVIIIWRTRQSQHVKLVSPAILPKYENISCYKYQQVMFARSTPRYSKVINQMFTRFSSDFLCQRNLKQFEARPVCTSASPGLPLYGDAKLTIPQNPQTSATCCHQQIKQNKSCNAHHRWFGPLVLYGMIHHKRIWEAEDNKHTYKQTLRNASSCHSCFSIHMAHGRTSLKVICQQPELVANAEHLALERFGQ
jgi:hypothetical protein